MTTPMRSFARPLITLSIGILLAWGTIPVRAATLTVSSTADAGAGTLREALGSAANGDTITFNTSGTIHLLSNLPTITLTDLTINGNGATVRGGTDIRSFTIEAGASVTIDNLTISGGDCSNACPIIKDGGGGIYNNGTLNFNNSKLSDNSAIDGGAIYSDGGTLTITDSTFSGNLTIYGGGIYNDGGAVSITNSTFSANSGSNSGGGIYNMDGTVLITNSTFSSNLSDSNGFGAGLYVFGGTITLIDSTLSGNSTRSGGGIYNSGGTVSITNSTVSGNVAHSGGGAGGLLNNVGATMTVTNSTISGNSADWKGGGITNAGTMTITNSTISGNSAQVAGDSIFNPVGTITLKNTLLGKGSGSNCTGTISSNGAAYNLADDGSCGANVTQVASLSLGVLGAYGGPTQTIPLLVGSPALDVALAADCPATDQRGVARPIDAGCDIGAFEGVFIPSVAVVPAFVPASAMCSFPDFPTSTQVSLYLPYGNNGLNVCYSLIGDPVEAGVTDRPFTLAAEVYTFRDFESVTTGLPIQVCLQGDGMLLFRDASGQPRTTVNLPSFSQNGFTCGLIPNAGTIILLPGAAAPAAAIAPIALSACRVTTTHILNLRAAPDAASTVLTLVPYQTALSASARSGEWLQVVFGAQQGWLSAAHLSLEGGCG